SWRHPSRPNFADGAAIPGARSHESGASPRRGLEDARCLASLVPCPRAAIPGARSHESGAAPRRGLEDARCQVGSLLVAYHFHAGSEPRPPAPRPISSALDLGPTSFGLGSVGLALARATGRARSHGVGHRYAGIGWGSDTSGSVASSSARCWRAISI